VFNRRFQNLPLVDIFPSLTKLLADSCNGTVIHRFAPWEADFAMRLAKIVEFVRRRSWQKRWVFGKNPRENVCWNWQLTGLSCLKPPSSAGRLVKRVLTNHPCRFRGRSQGKIHSPAAKSALANYMQHSTNPCYRTRNVSRAWAATSPLSWLESRSQIFLWTILIESIIQNRVF
jgi:hypothetical protein